MSGSGEQETEKAVVFQLPFIMLKTKRGIAFMDRLGRSRIVKPVGWILLYVLPILAAVGFYLILRSVTVYFSSPLAREFARTIGPLANVLLPGINPYLPIFYGWAALVVGLAVHEGSHGVMARSLGFRVKSGGLLFLLVIPIGAFVELDEKELQSGRARDSTRVLAAGPGSNTVVGVASLIALILLVGSMVPIVNGVGVSSVFEGFPAMESGIRPGDIVTHVNGVPTKDLTAFYDTITKLKPGEAVEISVFGNGQIKKLNLIVPRGVMVMAIVQDSPAQEAGIQPGDLITAINGQTVESREHLGEILSTTKPREEAIVTVLRKDSTKIFRIRLASNPQNPSIGFIGISPQANLVQALGIGPIGLQETLDNYRNFVFTAPFVYLLIPTFAQAQQMIPFSDTMRIFYTSSIGDLYYPVANLLFWIWFINFNLAIFNALPIYPLDGGQTFRSVLRAVAKGRLSESSVTKITLGVTLLMVFLVVSMIALPYIPIPS